MTRVALFGATGTAGRGCLRELLRDTEISSVLTIGRRATGAQSPKLRELVVSNPSELSPVARELKDLDACLYCLGISAVGMGEAEYTAITKTMTLKVLDTLLVENPNIRFLYISGNGTDAKAKAMWARVKGETENEIFARSPEKAVIFRPGLIEPRDGIKGQDSLLYKMTYAAAPLLRCLRLPVTDTQALGRAMVAVAKGGSSQKILENNDINEIELGV